MKKVITYHSTVKQAKDFVFGSQDNYPFDSILDNVINTDNKSKYFSHVNGTMSSSTRTGIFSNFKKNELSIMTNFSPFKGDREKHPWMGLDRYNTAERMLKEASPDFDVADCFEILRKVSQEVCPTVVSMVLDCAEMKVYWCENRRWDSISEKSFV